MATPFTRNGITYDLEEMTGLGGGFKVRGLVHPSVELALDQDVDDLYLAKYISRAYRADPPLDITDESEIGALLDTQPIIACLAILKKIYEISGLIV